MAIDPNRYWRRGYTGAPAAAAGTSTVTIRPRSSAGMLVHQLATETVNGAGTAVEVSGLALIRVAGWLIAPVRASGDAACGPPPIPVEPGEEMTVEYTGLPVGTIPRVTAIWTEYQA